MFLCEVELKKHFRRDILRQRKQYSKRPNQTVVSSVPSKKNLHRANVAFSAHAIAQSCTHATNGAFQAVKELREKYKILNF